MTARRPSQRGSGLLEGAFALTTMLFVMLAAIEAGRYLYARQMVPHLAREGARWALVHPQGDARPHVLPLAVGIPARELEIRTLRQAGSVAVEAEWAFRSVLPLPPLPVRSRTVLPVKRSAETPAPAAR